MIVVADTTPLLYLSRTGKLQLLERLYRHIIVPVTVWQEAVVARSEALGVQSLRDAEWIEVSDRAERAGVDPELQDELQAEGFRVASQLVSEALRQVGE